MKPNEAAKRIEELERRVRELEARPVYLPQPVFVPYVPVYPSYPPSYPPMYPPQWWGTQTPLPGYEVINVSSNQLHG